MSFITGLNAFWLSVFLNQYGCKPVSQSLMYLMPWQSGRNMTKGPISPHFRLISGDYPARAKKSENYAHSALDLMRGFL